MIISPSLSTIWTKGKDASLNNFFDSAKAIGFEYFELDGAVSLRDIANLTLPEGQIPSLEVPCPAHPQTFDANFSSTNRYEQTAAKQAAQSSFELAADLKSNVLIVRLGQVEISPKAEQVLKSLWQATGSKTEDFKDLSQELIAARARNAAAQIRPMLKDVEFLAEQAQRFGVKIGLATPPHYTGLPLPDELALILEEFGDPVYYWHNPAHAKILDTLTLVPDSAWTDVAANHLIGMYLNDVRGLQSGLVPHPNGEINFKALAPYMTPNTHLTCRFAANYSAETIKTGLQTIKEIFNRSEK